MQKEEIKITEWINTEIKSMLVCKNYSFNDMVLKKKIINDRTEADLVNIAKRHNRLAKKGLF